MKKIILAFFLVLLLNNLSFAQSKYNLGIVFGPNYTSLRGSDFLQDTDSGFGFLVGVSLEYKINKNLAIGTGLNFEQKNINYETDFTVTYIDELGLINDNAIHSKTINKYKYLTVPLLVKYNFGKSKSLFIDGGLFISFLQDHKKESSFVNLSGGSIIYDSKSKYNFPLADDVAGDYGVSFGFGKSFELNDKNKISIEIRDNLGLKNTIENINNYGESGVIKTNSLNLIASWSFSL